MTFLCIVLCFAAALVGGLFGVQVLFWVAQPATQLTIDLTLKENPVCTECGKSIGVRTIFKNTLQAESTLDGKSTKTSADL